jgi:hypothetical protein
VAIWTIPKSLLRDFTVAFETGLLRAEALGLEPSTNEPVRKLLEEHAEAQAQIALELRVLKKTNRAKEKAA